MKTRNYKNKPVVLALALRSGRLAAALFSGDELIYYDSCGLNSKRLPAAAVKVVQSKLENFIKTYDPDFLALEKIIYRQQKLPQISDLYRATEIIAEKFNLPVRFYSPLEARAYLCGADKKPVNKPALRALARLYPEFKRYLNCQSKWQVKYAALLFRAIAIGYFGMKIAQRRRRKQS